MAKSYDPAAVEKDIFAFWQSGERFKADPAADGDPFCIVIPPPNVTGALHLGHALNNTLQDILIRRARMQGRNAFWLVGTDHAGIATQATVEKTIRKDENKSRHDLGRDEMVKRIWAWKEKFGGRIVEQLKLMGCSCDYSRERFTLDEMCAKAVRETFFKLFRDGLIYRGKRLVNWDTQLRTAVADDEVVHETVKGKFYYFKYPIIDPKPGEPEFVHIATTRPETMLADTAVAVHPNPEAALDQARVELEGRRQQAKDKERAGYEKSLEELAERRTTMLPLLKTLSAMAKDGRKIRLPLTDREIPLICDEWANPALGTGCVKITPAHDPNDYEVARRHDLPMISVLTDDGKVAEIIETDGTTNKNSGNYASLAFSTDGRKKVVEDLEALDLVEKIEDRQIELGHSDRSKAPIEPYLSDQWFVRMGDLEPDHAAKIEGLRHKAPGLAQMAIDAVQRGDFTFHPARYEKTYVDWLGEKRDWCISRQLWWGHRIPVWTLPSDSPIPLDKYFWDRLGTLSDWVTEGRAFARLGSEALFSHEGVILSGDSNESLTIAILNENDEEIVTLIEDFGFVRDPDVLDTWFSSALWPHSTLGWPDASLNKKASLLGTYYPTSVLSTAREIITLWVARMVMTGLYNVGKIPFRDVVIHPVIQDGNGQKMSKSLGNGVDPVDIIDFYGADALRFTLADLATETQDIRMPVKAQKLPDGREVNVSPKFEQGRNFCNKLWQASTGYVFAMLDGYDPKPLDPKKLRLEDRWILSKSQTCLAAVNKSLDGYRFSEAMKTLYSFMWDDYCSDYIEMTKARLQGAGDEKAAAQQVLIHVLDTILRMLHPFIPFVTESLWHQLNEAAPKRGLTRIINGEPALMTAAWPAVDDALLDESVEAEMQMLQGVIKSVREIRGNVNVYRSKAKEETLRTLPSAVLLADDIAAALVNRYTDFVTRLAGCDAIEVRTNGAKPEGVMTNVVGAMQICVPVADLLDLNAVQETERKKLDDLRKQLASTEKRMSNEAYVRNAPPEIVEETQQRIAELRTQIAALASSLGE
ncbi:MAG: valine--tRNA ligase [Phycisphaerales bacterium]|nr:valine--tRNA ligase [Phycisphaerales bacterium]MCB9855245.1 valine--tRNA ligase [Phycisphaerales bacterium]MCB9862838.1 valine--tRNA ligase [Phycisphaerales bacterium]